jgi:hypothetical protein
MPAVNDYECTGCGRVEKDVLILRSSETHPPPLCPACGQLMRWLPAAGHGGVSSLKGFEFDGQEVTTLRQAQAIERETMKRYLESDPSDPNRPAPVRFRALHQDHSNMDRNTFGPKPDQNVPKTRRGLRFKGGAFVPPEEGE